MPIPFPLSGGYSPVVSGNFAQSLNDFTSLSTLSSMPTGGSISRNGQAMYYDSTGKLTYAQNNLLTYSNTLSNSSWSKDVGGSVVGGITDPFGGTSAWQGTRGTTTSNPSFFGQYLTSINASFAYIYSVWLQVPSGTMSVQLSISDYTTKTVSSSNITVTTTWQRFSYVMPAGTLNNTTLMFVGLAGSGLTSGSKINIYGEQLELVTYVTTPSSFVETGANAYFGPRFDYYYDTVSSTWKNRGLLVEGARTNLLTYSEQFDNAAWIKSNITVTANGATSPDGTTTADKLVVNNGAATDTYSAYRTAVVSSGAVSFSIYAKAAGWNYIRVVFGGSYASTEAIVNLTTGAITGQSGTVTATSIGNGWWRIVLSSVYVSASDQNVYFWPTNASAYPWTTGNGTDGVYVWGGQSENASFASSYIPTVASSAARAAETFAITGYSSQLIDAFYTDEETGGSYSLPYNAGVAPSPSYAWLTSLRAYQNAYAGDIATASWIDNSGTTGNRMVTDSTGTLTWAPANMLVQSNTFNTTWILPSGNTNIATTSATTDPLGGSSAWLLSENTTASQSFILRQTAIPSTNGVTLVASVYVKAQNRTQAFLQLYDGTANGFAYFSLNSSTVSGASTDVAFSNNVDVGNGWRRISLAIVSKATGTSGWVAMAPAVSGTNTYTGVVGNGIYVYGAQLEQVTWQQQPRALIPTTSAAIYQPRYDYDASVVPATPRGMLIEESRTNICQYSGVFQSAGPWWYPNDSPSLTTTNIAPDGTATAYSWAFNTGSTGYYTTQPSLAASTTYAVSLFVKVISGSPRIQFGSDNSKFGGGANTQKAFLEFTPSTGAFSNVQSGVIAYDKVYVGNGWWRVWFTTTKNSTAEAAGFIAYLVSSGTMAVWGYQIEAGSFATSYIPTTSASVTRAADVVKLTGSALTTAGAATGSIIAQTTKLLSTSAVYFVISGNTNRRPIFLGNNTTVYSFDGSSYATATIGGSGTWTGGPVRAAVGWTNNALSLVANNGTIETTTLNLGTDAGPIYLGGYAPAPSAFNGWIASTALYNQRLPDAILKQKSTVGVSF